jgi:hypothetical protein
LKLVRTDKYEYFFQLERKEHQILLALLDLYPVIPVAHHHLSKNEPRTDAQQLLESSLAAHRNDGKKQIQAMINSATTFVENAEGCDLVITSSQMEWLLQVLNDVRIGSWLAMGSPAGPQEILTALNLDTGRYYWAMEMAGEFQMCFLRAISVAEQNPPATD